MAQQQGYLMRLMVPGHRSGITRAVYVYLPPQYFEPGYQVYRFPVIELIHGQPGGPQDWITVVGVTHAYDGLLQAGRAQPAVLVMPDANGGEKISLQCLNQAGGPPDLPHLPGDPPTQMAPLPRVAPPGPAWGGARHPQSGVSARNPAPPHPPRSRLPGGASRH